VTLSKTVVLVVDSDAQARKLVRVILRPDGFRLVEAATGRDALGQAKSYRPDVILVDRALPDMDGVEVIGELRKWFGAPILVISDMAGESEKVQALEAGADDYLTKPFGGAELLARVQAALRRATRSPQNAVDSVISVGDLRIDLSKRVVFVKGAEVHLTPLEYRLFGTLMRKAGAVITGKQLLREVWGPDCEEQSEYLRVYVKQLRRKLEEDPQRPRYLINEPGVGYRIRNND
jgi:two-component system KDP operon response regulator KdpE